MYRLFHFHEADRCLIDAFGAFRTVRHRDVWCDDDIRSVFLYTIDDRFYIHRFDHPFFDDRLTACRDRFFPAVKLFSEAVSSRFYKLPQHSFCLL